MSQSSADRSPSINLPEAGFKLSPQQQRLWQLCQSSSAYRICGAVEIEGDLDSVRLESAARQVAEGHEILRTCFVRQPGSRLPLQAPTGSIVWDATVDLASLTPAEQTAEFDRCWVAMIQRGSEEEGVALRLQVVRLAATKHRLLLNLSPLCGDGVTLGLIVREIAGAYAALSEAERVPTEGLPYFQFAAWQNELLETPDALLEEAQAFWSSRPSPSPMFGLPVRRELPPLPGFAPERVSVQVDAELRDALAHGTVATEIPESGFLFACWCAYLWRWTQSDEAVVGYVSDGRPFEELREVLGLVARCLPVPCTLTGDLSFRAFAAGSQERLEEAQEWQDYFLFAPTTPGDDGAPGALELAFEYEERTPQPSAAADLTWTLCRQDVVLEPFQLKLACIREAGSLTAELVFDSYMYDRADAERLLHGWLALVRDAVRNPDRSLDRLQLLDEEQRNALTARNDETRRAYPAHRCFHTLFEEQALRTPDAIAVRFASDALTYRDLDARADRLAARLQELGVVPESRVALCLTRSPELLVALLAVLKAGSAYVPMDTTYPAERLAQIVDDSAPTVVLTRADLVDRLPQTDTPLICMENEPWLDALPIRPETVGVGPDNLAYVLYTSGSTGRPKGVMVPHRGLVNYLHWAAETYQVASGSGTLVDTPIGFDLTITSLLSPLIVGQTAVLVPEEEGLEGLAAALQRAQDVTLVKTTPSHLEVLSNLVPAEAAGASRLFVIGGEALRWETLAFFQRNAPATRLVNEYGPTETVVGCCVYEASGEPGSGASVPIGHPIANTRLYLFDAGMQPVPMGMPGELYVGGAGVARGYLGRPDLTAERFLPDPFSPDHGARLYKTGDLCRYLPDGNLEYLGRTDHQVKIRGYRIELGEVESVLMAHPAVAETLVLAREDTPGEKRLVAYLVGEEGALDSDALREYLQDKLPDYMTPAAFVLLDAFPLSPNGKIDRKALPAAEAGGEKRREYVAPRTPIEESIAEIWRAVLRLERVGIHDSFFELGGHSLLATQVFSRIRDTFQTELPLRTLFEAPTLAELAERIASSRGDALVGAPVLTRASRDSALPLSFAQQRIWLIDQIDPDSAMFNMPLAFRLTGKLDLAALQASFTEILRRHEVLRTVYPAHAGNPTQVVSSEEPDPPTFVDLSDRPEAERDNAIRQLLTESARTSFDLAQGPLYRTQLVRLAPEDHVLLFVTHHIAWDGGSNGVLMREWSALYNAFLEGRPSPLPALPFQYADYAAWQRDWVEGSVSEAQLSHWRSQLNGADFGLPVRTDRPETAEPDFEGSAEFFTCAAEVADPLKELAREEKASLYMVLLAAFNVLLYQDARQEDICIGTPVSGRRWTETESLIGLFLNTLVMRTNLSGDPSFRTLVSRVRQTVLGAHANQDLPFERVVDALKPRRDLSHTPLFRVWFVLNEGTQTAAEFSGLTVQGIGSGLPPAKYALWMSFAHIPDGLRGSVIYQKSLFDATTIERLTQKMEKLLSVVAADPDITLVRIAELLAEVDRQAREQQEQRLDEANRMRLGKRTRTAIRG